MASIRQVHALQLAEQRRRERYGTFVIVRDANGTEIGTRRWPNVLPPHRSPCRADSAKGVRMHRCSDAHADQVRGYRAAVAAWELGAEAATNGHAAELAEYAATNPRPTFRDYLTGTGRSRLDREGS